MIAKGDSGSNSPNLKELPSTQPAIHKSQTSGNSGESEDVRFFNLNVRAFIFKALQIVVLSRTGNKFAYNSQKIGGSITNCYLSLEDDPEVAAEIKRELSSNFMLGPGDSVTLEIYVELNGREVMSLEVWHFHMASAEALQSESSGEGIHQEEHAVIHSMNRLVEILGLALKSLLCITRILPAYRLARDPGENNLKFLYKISFMIPKKISGGSRPPQKQKYKDITDRLLRLKTRLQNREIAVYDYAGAVAGALKQCVPSPPPHDMTGLLGSNPKSKRIMFALTEMGRFELNTFYRSPLIINRCGSNYNVHGRGNIPRGRHFSPERFNEEEEDEETCEISLRSEPCGRHMQLRSPPLIRSDGSETNENSEILLESLLQEANRIEQQQTHRQPGEGNAESTGEEDEDKHDGDVEDDLQFELDDAGTHNDTAVDEDDRSLDLPFALDAGDVELNRLLSDLHRAASLDMFRSNCSASQQIECIEQQLEIFEKELKEFDDMIVYQDPDRDID